jgi:membrane protease YdiL (CAAX protease family)
MNPTPERMPRGWHVFLIILGTFLLYICLTLVFGGSTNKVHILLLETVLIIPTLLFVWIQKYSFHKVFRFRWIHLRLIILSVFLGFGLGIISDELDRMVQSAVPMPEHILKALQGFMIFKSTQEMFLLIFTVVIFAGMIEEMLFRGFMQGALERSGHEVKAIAVTAMVFSFLHFNPWWAFQIFVLGTVLGVLAWRSDSIFPGVVIHMVNNAVSMAFMNTDESKLHWYLFRGHVSSVCLATGLILVYFGFRLFFKFTKPVNHQTI